MKGAREEKSWQEQTLRTRDMYYIIRTYVLGVVMRGHHLALGGLVVAKEKQ